MKSITFNQYTFFSSKKLILRVETPTFLLVVSLDNFLRNIRKFGSIVIPSRLMEVARSFFFLHRLLLKRVLVVCRDRNRQKSSIWIRFPGQALRSLQKKVFTDTCQN